jgi:hypothetical protein
LSAFFDLLSDHDLRKFNKHTAAGIIRFVGNSIFQNHAAEISGLMCAGIRMINDLIESSMIPKGELFRPRRAADVASHACWNIAAHL